MPPPKNQANAKKQVSDRTGALPPPKKTPPPQNKSAAPFVPAGKGGLPRVDPARRRVCGFACGVWGVGLRRIYSFCLLIPSTLYSRPARSTPKLLLLRTSLERVTWGAPTIGTGQRVSLAKPAFSGRKAEKGVSLLCQHMGLALILKPAL